MDPDDDEPVPLPNVNGAIMRKVNANYVCHSQRRYHSETLKCMFSVSPCSQVGFVHKNFISRYVLTLFSSTLWLSHKQPYAPLFMVISHIEGFETTTK